MSTQTTSSASRAAREELVLSFSPSWKGMLGWYIKRLLIATLVCVLVGLAWQKDALEAYWFFLVLVVSFGGVLGIGKLIRQATVYRISTRRVSETTGIFNKKTESAFFTEITNTTVEQNILERILKVGRVDFDTAGEQRLRREEGRASKGGKNYLAFWGVPSPHHLEATVDGLRFGDDDHAIPHDDYRTTEEQEREAARQAAEDAKLFED
jgi:uncharacterized membrane protein YdbT with pleckstrin-like domain